MASERLKARQEVGARVTAVCLTALYSAVLCAQPHVSRAALDSLSVYTQLSRIRDYTTRRPRATVQSEPADGATVPYLSFAGQAYNLIQYNGLHVAFLIQPSSLQLGRYTVPQLREVIDHLDVLYAHFTEIMGREPAGTPLLHIAFVNTCGGGCGQLGAKGIELAPEMLDPAHGEYPDDSPYVYAIHEMTHNFDFYSSFIMYGPDTAHAWTDFMNFYIAVYNQEGFSSNYPADLMRFMVDVLFTPYLTFPNSNWTTCIANNACAPTNGMAQHAQGGMVLRIAQLHGPAGVKAAIQYLQNAITTGGLAASQLSVSGKNGLLLEALGNGMRVNLSCYMDAWNWPIPSSLRDQFNTKYGQNPNCLDQDADGYTPVQGDLDDRNLAVHPGATEVVNGIDDDCDGIVDDVFVAETAEFGKSVATATPVPFPVRITGTVKDQGDADVFQMTVQTAAHVRFRFKSLGTFAGWIFLDTKDNSAWLQTIYASAGQTIFTDIDLPAGTWTFSVGYNVDSTIGDYEVAVYPTSRWPWPVVAPTPKSLGAGTVQLATPPVPPQLAGMPALAARFWVEGSGWVGTNPLDAAGSATLSWTEPAGFTRCVLSYRVQFIAGTLPQSPPTQSAEFAPYPGPCTLPGSAVSTISSVLNQASLDAHLSPGTLAVVSGVFPPSNTPDLITVANLKAKVLSGTSTQITIEIPVNAPVGPTTVEVGNSAPYPITLSPYAPALRSADSSGSGTVSAIHQNTSLAVTSVSPAEPGEIIALYATGLGPTQPAVATGQMTPSYPPFATIVQPTLTIGGQLVPVLSSTLVPGLIGIYSVSFQMPATSDGSTTLTIAGFSSNTLTLPFDAAAATAPFLIQGSAANAATYLPGGLVPGSWAQVKGNNLSTVARTWAASDFTGLGNRLPSVLEGVRVSVNGIGAAVYYVDPHQVTFQVPSDLAPAGSGTVSVQVTSGTVSSNTVTVRALNNAPGIFPIIVNGTNYAAGVFLDGEYLGDPSVIPQARKAQAGDQIQLFATGLVPSPAGTTVNTTPVSGVTVTIGSITVPADAAALVAPGEFQINFTVPQNFAGLPAANYPISIQVNGVSSPVTIDSDPPGPLVIPIGH